MDRRCPDCGVGMEPASLISGESHARLVLDEPNESILGRLGVKKRVGTDALTCPECGLIRLYADSEELE